MRTTDRSFRVYEELERMSELPCDIDFIKDNILNLNHMYSENYEPYHFVVDTENGSTTIQNLIDTELAQRRIALMDFEGLNRIDRISKLYKYVLMEYSYIVEPNIWPTVAETMKWKKGDCKGLSILLISLLLASGFEARTEISNGHMWVNVKAEGEWSILDLDHDADRALIYKLPGFYENPLYRIYEDRTEKRIPKSK